MGTIRRDAPQASQGRSASRLRTGLMCRERRAAVLVGGAAVVGTLLAAAACALGDVHVPPLTGPSELALAIAATATPDAIVQDGLSQSRVNVSAKDAMGQPVRGLSLHVAIEIMGSPTDFGNLSALTIATDPSGRAAVIYTAPP